MKSAKQMPQHKQCKQMSMIMQHCNLICKRLYSISCLSAVVEHAPVRSGARDSGDLILPTSESLIPSYSWLCRLKRWLC